MAPLDPLSPDFAVRFAEIVPISRGLRPIWGCTSVFFILPMPVYNSPPFAPTLGKPVENRQAPALVPTPAGQNALSRF